jgi:SAM-dependent methyltransferase
MLRRELFIADPSLWFWTPAFSLTLAWLKARLPSGATVLEVGSGLGFVLHALRRDGFNPVGLDVAESAVTVTREDGFKVWHGTLESMPPEWVQADAVIAFFMLHHLVDPIATLKEIRRRWPSAPLLVSQYGPTSDVGQASMPPRTLTRWNSRSLEQALTTAGYSATVTSVPSSGLEHSAMRPVGWAADHLIRSPALYRIVKRAARRVGWSRLLRPARRPDFVLLGVGEPA